MRVRSRTASLLLALLLLAGGCERFLGEKEPAPAIDRERAERVVDRVCAKLTEVHEKGGPLTALRLPEIKQEAAKAEGFANGWYEFQESLQSTDGDLVVAYSRRITEHLKRLGESSEEEER
jgi:hypothetical protein